MPDGQSELDKEKFQARHRREMAGSRGQGI